MPDAWTNKDERQYEHIKKAEEQRGKGKKRAKEIAARTVNKGRRLRGDTPNQVTQGTGNPNQGLEERSRAELFNRAKQLHITGYSRMKKAELIRAIRKAA